MSGTVRAFTNEVMEFSEARIRDISQDIAKAFGASVTMDFRIIFLPLVNTASEAEFAADTAAELVGEENMERNGPQQMSSEDFSYMLDKCPGAYMYIGNKGGDCDRECAPGRAAFG
jgi:hippurate hydrolase